MSYRKIFLLLSMILILCAGCGGINEGVIQNDPRSFILFSGNIQNAIAYIDDLTPINLDNDLIFTSDDGVGNSTKSRKNLHYSLSPGKHKIVIKKAGEEVVNRNILLGDGITKEIQIP